MNFRGLTLLLNGTKAMVYVFQILTSANLGVFLGSFVSSDTDVSSSHMGNVVQVCCETILNSV